MPPEEFWLRNGPLVPFGGLTQDGKSHCVYASVAGAMNHIAVKAHWTVDALVKACLRGGYTSPTFDTVAPIAADPLKDLVRYEIARERMKSLTTSSFIAKLSKWIKNGGLAVISLEAADAPFPGGKRLEKYHMFTLVAKHDNLFQVWDTNGLAGFVMDSELETGFKYPPIPDVCNDPWMIKHPEHDCVLFYKA